MVQGRVVASISRIFHLSLYHLYLIWKNPGLTISRMCCFCICRISRSHLAKGLFYIFADHLLAKGLLCIFVDLGCFTVLNKAVCDMFLFFVFSFCTLQVIFAFITFTCRPNFTCCKPKNFCNDLIFSVKQLKSWSRTVEVFWSFYVLMYTLPSNNQKVQIHTREVVNVLCNSPFTHKLWRKVLTEYSLTTIRPIFVKSFKVGIGKGLVSLYLKTDHCYRTISVLFISITGTDLWNRSLYISELPAKKKQKSKNA